MSEPGSCGREEDRGDGLDPLNPAVAWARPWSDDALHRWLAEALDIEVPREALLAGHASPFDYLRFAFFEDGEPLSCGEAPSSDCVVWANRGGGKTYLGAIATCLDLVFKPGIAVRILGGSLEQSRRMHAHLAGLFGMEALAPLVSGRVTRDRIELVNGSVCEVLAQSQTSVRGTRVQKLRCDEVELFDPELWDAAQLVTRSKRCGRVWVRGSVEALSTMHRPYGLMFRIVREASEGSRRLFKWGVVDVLRSCGDAHVCEGDGGEVCALFEECGGRAKSRRSVSEGGDGAGHVEVRDAIDLKRRVGRHTWESEMLSLRPSRSDCVLPEFDVREHVVDAAPSGHDAWRVVCGVDFGFRAPTVVLIARVDPEGRLWVLGEVSASGMLLRRAIERIVGVEPVWVGVDPAGRQRSEQTGMSNVQQMRRAGLVVRDRRVPLVEGVGLVRARLRPADTSAAPRLFVHRSCGVLIESLERYRYPEDDPESVTPVKDGADHAVDALRYLVQNLDRPTRTETGTYL